MEGAIRQEVPETLPLFPALQANAAVADGAAATSGQGQAQRESQCESCMPQQETLLSVPAKTGRRKRAKTSFVKGSSAVRNGAKSNPTKSNSRKNNSRKNNSAHERARLDPAFSATRLPNQTDADDYHMAIAWRLSKAMKGVKTGHRDAKALRGMTPGQKHQVGNVICGHLLASLRAQVAAETNQH